MSTGGLLFSSDKINHRRMEEVFTEAAPAHKMGRDFLAPGQAPMPPTEHGVFIYQKFRPDLLSNEPLIERQDGEIKGLIWPVHSLKMYSLSALAIVIEPRRWRRNTGWRNRQHLRFERIFHLLEYTAPYRVCRFGQKESCSGRPANARSELRDCPSVVIVAWSLMRSVLARVYVIRLFTAREVSVSCFRFVLIRMTAEWVASLTICACKPGSKLMRISTGSLPAAARFKSAALDSAN